MQNAAAEVSRTDSSRLTHARERGWVGPGDGSCRAAELQCCIYVCMDVRERVNWPVDVGQQQVDEQLLHSLHFWERGEPPSHCSLECLECLTESA